MCPCFSYFPPNSFTIYTKTCTQQETSNQISKSSSSYCSVHKKTSYKFYSMLVGARTWMTNDARLMSISKRFAKKRPCLRINNPAGKSDHRPYPVGTRASDVGSVTCWKIILKWMLRIADVWHKRALWNIISQKILLSIIRDRSNFLTRNKNVLNINIYIHKCNTPFSIKRWLQIITRIVEFPIKPI